MTNLTKHIADGPYVVMGDSIFEATESYIICESTPESDVNQLCEVMNYPAKVLEVLREEYQAIRRENNSGGATHDIMRYDTDSVCRVAVALGFSREDMTK